ncbi:hypothetical protein RRG08_014654 [Elysia crispata]|uniref:Uncharacterized protein n=1 Tax=Elysia crispata TaxID=231223 RepID=A0AAE1CYV0_9GAST|nr:hypothetical protein RRG08_014654 [Elysia crispata]
MKNKIHKQKSIEHRASIFLYLFMGQNSGLVQTGDRWPRTALPSPLQYALKTISYHVTVPVPGAAKNHHPRGQNRSESAEVRAQWGISAAGHETIENSRNLVRHLSGRCSAEREKSSSKSERYLGCTRRFPVQNGNDINFAFSSVKTSLRRFIGSHSQL